MRYICQICGYVYYDEKEKNPFDQLPEDWKFQWKQQRSY